jgi:inward rectifier potassium channel
MNKPTDKNEFQDLGLGTKVTGKGERMINPDGSFNVERRGLKYFEEKGIYHWLISMPWNRFVLLLISGYLVLNLFFSALYCIVGLETLDGMRATTYTGKFAEAFFFSAQTFTTVGYGRVNPVGFWANVIASVESMGGLMAFALATGILYGRFSRPQVKILYSGNGLISPYRDITAFMFRIANQRSNQLIELEASVTFSFLNYEDRSKREFRVLKLERKSINFFPTTWTIVHPIDEDSPMRDFSKKDLLAMEAEVVILLKAFDDSFSQTVYSRSSYKAEDMVVGAKFVNIYGQNAKGITTVDLHRINEHVMVEIPVMA